MLDALRAMELPSGLFCEQRERGESSPRGRSLRYSLMVELGLRRADGAGYAHGFDLDRLRHALLSELDSGEVTTGDLGLHLWADERAGGSRADELVARLEPRLAGDYGADALVGMELAWIVHGLALNSRRGDRGAPLFRDAFEALLRRQAPSGLFRHTRRGRRSRFPNFATQIYAVLALSLVAQLGLDKRALPAARRAADRLVVLQRPDGGWPWLYDVHRSRVVEPYDIYSVHQHGMAPMGLLELSEAAGADEYLRAARDGFEWILGRNDLGLSMVDEDARLIYRSIRRAGRLAPALSVAHAATATLFGSGVPIRGRLELNAVCFSYELGWLLEAWCGREERLVSAPS